MLDVVTMTWLQLLVDLVSSWLVNGNSVSISEIVIYVHTVDTLATTVLAELCFDSINIVTFNDSPVANTKVKNMYKFFILQWPNC